MEDRFGSFASFRAASAGCALPPIADIGADILDGSDGPTFGHAAGAEAAQAPSEPMAPIQTLGEAPLLCPGENRFSRREY